MLAAPPPPPPGSVAAVVKVYPAFLLPSAFIIAARGWRPVAAAAGAAAVFLLPVASALPAVVESRLLPRWTRHRDRERMVQSVTAAGQFGYDVAVVYRYGAVEVTSTVFPTLKLLSSALSIAVVMASCAIAYWRLWRNDAVGLATLWFAVIGCCLTGSVLSPDFLYGFWPSVLERMRLQRWQAFDRPPVVRAGSDPGALPLPLLASSWMFPDAVILLTIRNGLLAALAVLAAREVWSRMNRHIGRATAGFPRAGSHVVDRVGAGAVLEH